jgi:hypothetical protein
MSQMEDTAFLQTIVMHTVIFNQPAGMDITTQVTISMDKDYSGASGGGAPSGH